MSDIQRRRVIVLRDFSYAERQGEEELAAQRFLQEPPEWADVLVQPPEFIPSQEVIAEAEIVVSFSLKRYPDQIFDWLYEHPKHVHVAQDWWEPVQPQSAKRNRLLEQAAAVVFHSPMHAFRYRQLYQVDPALEAIIPHPLTEQPTQFSLERIEDISLWCAPWHADYGNDLLLRWAERNQRRVHAFGLGVPSGQISEYVWGMGPLALDVAAPTFRQYDSFVFFPRTAVPFGYTVLLAYVLGLELRYTNEIGCMSYASMEVLMGQASRAAQSFWNIVEEVAA